MRKQAVLSLSGGMDSSSLLLHLLANGYEVTALGFDYGQKHKVELERATSLVQYLNDGYDSEAENIPYHKVKHQIIKLVITLVISKKYIKRKLVKMIKQEAAKLLEQGYQVIPLLQNEKHNFDKNILDKEYSLEDFDKLME
jgi:7-cyano-7-deazaguanine synthase in queuosine biosynthesis